jgi:serine-type D-Ala-D-Ala carboxypeptidase/endopeptidase (penicillin-binding protein 4)
VLGAVPLTVGGLPAVSAATSRPRGGRSLADRIQEIVTRPEFEGAHWGMRIHSLRTGESVHAMNADVPFVSASAGKVFTAGAAFSALGGDHRFRTGVYRTGPIARQVLKGDLVLVAGGDLLIGGRVGRDGSLALPMPDHSYGVRGKPGPGDPMWTIRHLARQVAARGVTRVEGRVRVDVSLFREAREDSPSGASLTISPMLINDNLVDVIVSPGRVPGEPGELRVSPGTGYVHVLNEVTTVAAADARPLRYTDDRRNPDGTRTVRLTGDIPVGGPSVNCPYQVPEPARFGEVAFAEALREAGVRVEACGPDTRSPSRYPDRNRLAEHVSPPLSEASKVMLKISSNIHPAYYPYLVGAIAGHDPDTAKATGRAIQRELYVRAGLDPDAPGSAEGRHSPDFFVRFLSHLASRPFYREFRDALPIMGVDGSLTDVQVGSPAVGHVYAKTGAGNAAGLVSRAMAGYIHPPNSDTVVFAVFTSGPTGNALGDLNTLAAEAQGEIATAVYESFPEVSP